MEIALNIYSIVLIIVGSIAGLISAYLFFKSGRAIRSFSLLTLGVTIWALAYAFELSSYQLNDMLFWIKLEYIGIALMPGFWLLFCIQFVGLKKQLNKKHIFLIFLLPAITLLMVWTNGIHNLHYSATTVIERGNINLLSIETGIWYIIHTIFFYCYLLFGIFLLLKKFFNTNHIIRKQIIMILVGASVPWVANLSYLVGYRPLEYIDATPYAFAVTGILISIGLVWFKLFKVLPVAREKIIEQTKDGILILDNDLQILDANTSAFKILNTNKGSLIGESALEVFRGQDEIINLFYNTDMSICEWITISDNEEYYFEITVNIFLNSQGIISGWFIVFRDITRIKRNEADLILARKEAEAASKVKSEFLSHMSHEIRTPLTGIIGFVELMKTSELNEELTEYVSIVETSANSLLHIVNEILDLSKIESGSLLLLPEPTNVKDLCRESLDMFAWQANSDSLKINYQISPDVPSTIMIDKMKIRQIIINLLGNAIKFTDKGEITLKVALVEEQVDEAFSVRFSVSDTGIGIAQEDQEKIFESFTQVKPKIESVKKFHGTGLGLTISNKLLELMGSKLQLKSQLGLGSTFYFDIKVERKETR